MALKDHVSDKTNWRTMLRNDLKDEDLKQWRDNLEPYLPEEVKPYFLAHKEETQINFPVQSYPEKINSLNLDKTATFEGELKGIKAQYLLLSGDRVFNLRGHEGYVIELEIGSAGQAANQE